MSARLLWIPVALLAALAFVATEDAEASPFKAARRAAHDGAHHGSRVYVGGRIAFPIRSRHHHQPRGHYREIVEYTGGYYVTRTREVEVPGRQIGWDFAGKPIYGPSRVEVETYQEWVPRRRIVKRVWVPHRRHVHHGHHGHIAVGGRIRIR